MEEVVVTARKRAENLQDVPGAVDAFSAEKIEQAGVTSMRDYVALTPSVTLVESQNSGFAFVNIRGLSQLRNSEPTVAVVIDGVLQTSSLGFSQELYDIQQIEVLKGPQGALYGRNSSGGAINITTKRPTDELEGFLRAGYGNGESLALSGSISGPVLGDSLLGRASASYRDADGWRDNVSTGRKVDPYEDLSVRTKLLWDPGDSFTADFRVAYSKTKANSSQFIVNSPNYLLPAASGGGLPGTAATFGGRSNGRTAPLPGVPASLSLVIGDPNNTTVKAQSNLEGIEDREVTAASLKLDWKLTAGTITAVSSYDDLELIGAFDGFPYFPFLQSSADPTAGTRSDAIVLPPAIYGPLASVNSTIGQNRFHDALSQEIRFTSPDDQRIRWIAGAYVVASNVDVMIGVNNDLGQGVVEQRTAPNIGGRNPTASWNSRFVATVAPVYSAAPALIPASCLNGPLPANVCAANLANPNRNAAALSYNFDRNDNLAYAYFGQLEFDLTDTVELSVALRYDRDEREQTISAPDALLPVFSFSSGREGDVRKAAYDSLQPKATLRWKPSSDLTLYGVYAQGFRSGGFNLSGVSAGVSALVAAGVPGMPLGVDDKWKQEDTESYEIGFKSGDLFDGSLALGGSVYYTRIDNAFTFFFLAPFNAQVIRNLDGAEVRGVELNATWRATDSLKVEVGYGLIDSEITDSSWLGSGGVDIVGNQLPLNPESTLSVGVTYSYSLGKAEGFTRVDYERLGETPFEPENFATRDPVNLVNLRSGMTWSNGVEVVAWAKNLTDEDYTAEFTNPNGISWPAKPRQYGVELTKRF